MKSLFKFTVCILLSFLYASCSKQAHTEISTFKVIKTEFEESISLEGTVEPVETIVLACPSTSDGDITYLLADGTKVNAGDLVCIIDDKRLSKRYNEALIRLEMAKAELSKTRANLDFQYALLEAQVSNNTAQTQIANLDTLQLSFLSPKERRIKELELQKVAIEKKKLEKKLKSLAIINNSELRKNEFEIRQLEDMIKTSKLQIEGLAIKSPVSGIVTLPMHYTGMKLKVGDNVWNNMPVVKIPNVNKVKVVFKAPEIDYKRIDLSDNVSYSFDAMPGNKAWGKISTKSPVGQPFKENSKVKFFEIEASVDSFISTPQLGLSAKCRIYLKRKENVIVIPQICTFDQDGIKVVYVKHDDTYEMRQISIGLSSQKNAIVTSGLKTNELIAFSKPKSDLVKSKTIFPNKKKKLANKNTVPKATK